MVFYMKTVDRVASHGCLGQERQLLHRCQIPSVARTIVGNAEREILGERISQRAQQHVARRHALGSKAFNLNDDDK